MNFNIDGISDEDLIKKYSVNVNGHRFVPSRVIDAIGRRQAALANRQAGDPGTRENPIFISGHAYIYSSTNKLIMWEDYDGLIPVGTGITVNINPNTMEAFTLTKDMQPDEAQRRMIRDAQSRPVVYTTDSPRSTPEQLKRFRANGEAKIRRMAKQDVNV